MLLRGTIVETVSSLESSNTATPRPDSLSTLLPSYDAALDALALNFSVHGLRDVLFRRDAIEELLIGKIEERRLVDDGLRADEKLRRLPQHELHEIRKTLAVWRQSLTPAPGAWWWFLDRALPARWERVERVLLLFSVVLFPFSLGVAIELARLLGDDIGFASLFPITATFLGSLSLGGVLSLSFRDRWALFLEELGLSARWRVLGTCVVCALLTAIVACWFARPRISRHYNARGVSMHLTARGPQTQLSSAQLDLERAVRFDPSNIHAHYNLGRVYEDLLDEDRAITEYLIAFRAGFDLAGNNVSHLYLLRGEYDRAAIVLQKTVNLSAPAGHDSDRELRYAMLKNFGWARYGQTRFAEAQQLLQEAVRLNRDGADAHCLLAKTLVALQDARAASEWRSCLGLAWQDGREPARETWIAEAKNFLGGAP